MDENELPPEPVSAEEEELDRYLNYLVHAEDATAVHPPDALDASLASLARGLDRLGRVLTLPNEGAIEEGARRLFDQELRGIPSHHPLDAIRICCDCGKEFVFTYREQCVYRDFRRRPPPRCLDCDVLRSVKRNGVTDAAAPGDVPARSGPKAVYAASCAHCGREAMVPFEKLHKPVYCDDCLRLRTTQNRRWR